MEDVPHTVDPRERLVTYALRYRETALAFRSHYAVMFGRAVPGFDPSDVARERALAAFEVIVAAARAAIREGGLKGRPRAVAAELWALVHGHVSLELAGHLPTGGRGARSLRRAVTHTLAGLAG